MPISLLYASAENETRLACWLFQPKRPIRALPSPSRTGTSTAVPRIDAGCASRMAVSVLLAIASMKPSPSVFSDRRNVRMSSWTVTISEASG